MNKETEFHQKPEIPRKTWSFIKPPNETEYLVVFTSDRTWLLLFNSPATF